MVGGARATHRKGAATKGAEGKGARGTYEYPFCQLGGLACSPVVGPARLTRITGAATRALAIAARAAAGGLAVAAGGLARALAAAAVGTKPGASAAGATAG